MNASGTAWALTALWRFVCLCAVGMAWGLPLLLVCFANTAPGVAEHPRVAALLEPLAIPVLLLAPVVAATGVALIGWLSRWSPRSNLTFAAPRAVGVLVAAAVVVWVVAVAVGASEFREWSFVVFLGTVYALIGASVLCLALGAAVSAAVLSKYGRWLSVLWLAAWAAIIALLWIGSRQSPDVGDDLGAGMAVYFGGILVVGATLIAAAVVVPLTGRSVGRDMETGVDDSGTSAAPIEQGV